MSCPLFSLPRPRRGLTSDRSSPGRPHTPALRRRCTGGVGLALAVGQVSSSTRHEGVVRYARGRRARPRRDARIRPG